MTPGDWPETETLLDGTATLAYAPADRSGALKMTIKHNGEIVHSGVVDNIKDDGHAGTTQRGKYRNAAEDAAEPVDGLDESDLATAIDRWFNQFLADADVADDEMRGQMATKVIAGTQTPVEIYGGAADNTSYKVTLTYEGRTNTLEFSASHMLPDAGPAPLQERLAHQYFKPVEVPSEDWEDIREYWAKHSEVVSVTETTPDDARADRLLGHLSDSINPVPDFEMLENGKRNAWVDTEYDREPDVSSVDPDIVVWVQDKHYADEIESVSSIDDKGHLSGKLRERKELVDKKRSRNAPTYIEGRDRPQLWAFRPGALGVNPADVEKVKTDGGVEP